MEFKATIQGLLIGDVEAIAKATDSDLAELSKATQVDMPVEQFHSLANDWISTAKDTNRQTLHSVGVPTDVGGHAILAQ